MKIVVRGTNWIGDAVMTIPALRALRGLFPDAKITLHTRSWGEGVFRDADFIDELLVYEKSKTAFKEVTEQSRALREKRFDLAILLPNSFASALTARFGGIPRRFGYSRNARRVFLTDPVAVPEWLGKRHEVFYYLNLIAAVENELKGTDEVIDSLPSIRLPISEGRRTAARRFLEENGANPAKKTVALGVGSANSRAKRWPEENYARLGDLLQHELSSNIILIGSHDDIEVSQTVAELSRLKPIVLSGMTDLGQATAILGEVDLLVSNDMGLAHISAAVGTRTLVIFGPTDPETTRPYSPVAEVISHRVECSPCMLRDCPIDHRCMTRISVEDVLERARIALVDTVGAQR
jgi:heptosyltransferase-2